MHFSVGANNGNIDLIVKTTCSIVRKIIIFRHLCFGFEL